MRQQAESELEQSIVQEIENRRHRSVLRNELRRNNGALCEASDDIATRQVKWGFLAQTAKNMHLAEGPIRAGS
jgi:hypothetical protein